MDLAEVLAHTKRKHNPQTTIFLFWRVWFRGHTKIGFVRQVKVTYDSEQFKIENQVKSMKNVDPLVPERRHLSRQNKRDNQVHTHILFPRCSYQLTNGSGVIFLSSMTSEKDPCLGGSRKSRQKSYDFMSLHREDDECGNSIQDGARTSTTSVVPGICFLSFKKTDCRRKR